MIVDPSRVSTVQLANELNATTHAHVARDLLSDVQYMRVQHASPRSSGAHIAGQAVMREFRDVHDDVKESAITCSVVTEFVTEQQQLLKPSKVGYLRMLYQTHAFLHMGSGTNTRKLPSHTLIACGRGPL
jgi:hypothetical protein